MVKRQLLEDVATETVDTTVADMSHNRRLRQQEHELHVVPIPWNPTLRSPLEWIK